MSEPLQILLGVLLVLTGMAVAGYAGYLQYGALPAEHTFAKGSVRLAVFLAGLALFVGGTLLLP